jgi:serine-type D-Ala-D-Ala carboxypeptidase/endopeptidase (penicillin-binding protein 4)
MTRVLRIGFSAVLLWLAAVPGFAAEPEQSTASVKHPATKPDKRMLALACRIDALLKPSEVAQGFWGIEIYSLDRQQTVYSLNPDKLFTPASNTKLITTAAAFELLGPQYHFRTTVESSGAIDSAGRLGGDLLLVGRGDPNISGRILPYNLKSQWLVPKLGILEELADQVAQKQIKVIDGDVVGDDSWFAFQRYGTGWAQDDLMWPDGAPASALTINDNTQTLTILPGATAGTPAIVTLDPDVPYYEIDNRIVTTSPGTTPRSIAMDRQPGSNVLVIWGAVPLDDTASSYAVAVDNPAKFAAMAFRGMLERRGIKVLGKERAAHALTANFPLQVPGTQDLAAGGKGGADSTPAAEPQRSILALHESLPLIEDLRVINKISQNLHAELVLRTLGRERGPFPTLEGSLNAVSNVLTGAGVEPQEYDLNDGSGMSLQNLITPRALVKLLRHADAAPWGALYRSTLPIAGMDGTISDRLKNTFAAGRIQAKTGTLGHVNTLAGYAQSLTGERLAFAIMCNNHKLTSSGAKHVIDNIALLMVDDAPRRRAPVLKRRKAARPSAAKPMPLSPPSPSSPE